jgi:phosphoenolpyruvate carboxylase
VLQESDDLLRTLFFSIVKETTGTEFYESLTAVYELSEKFHETQSEADFASLSAKLDTLTNEESMMLASAFSNVLNLHNVSEHVASAMEERHARLDDIPRGPAKTTNGAIKGLVAKGTTPQEIYDALCEQEVDLVLTAHPTQALRRSMLKNFGKIRQCLLDLQRSRLSGYERAELLDGMTGAIQAAWRTDEIRRNPPKPQDEMRAGLSYFNDTIFHGYPKFCKRIDTALKNQGLDRIPFDRSIVRFSSWMGGDRDGNPNVTATCTNDVVYLARVTASNLYFNAIQNLIFSLSMWRCTPEFKQRALEIQSLEKSDDVYEMRKRRNYSDFWRSIPMEEPYRVILAEVRDKLYNTREALQEVISGKREALDPEDDSVFTSKEQLLEPLMACYQSLKAVGDASVADGFLLDLIRQVNCFGLSLVKLDIRQESDRHADAMDAITRHIGLGSYNEWDEEKRTAFLASELEGKRPLIANDLECSAEVREVLDTFKMIAHLQKVTPGSLGTYVISMATVASDVLAVVLLQRECGGDAKNLLRVAPLFERLDDLRDGPSQLRRLFSVPWYLDHIAGFQEVMIGYSDSGKDAGRLAAAWALYEGQEMATAVGNEFGVKLTLFHGRGGTVGRGGGPSHLAIMSQPPATINGRLRVTVQGEVIEQNFGEHENCFHTLDLYTAATLEHTLKPPDGPQDEWRGVMAEMERVSCARYREIVFQTPQFNPYFIQATPGQELGSLNIGSRPSKRKSNAGVVALRAIPWIFAWTQSRFHLPVWLGMAEAFDKMKADGKLPTLRAMYQKWPFFKVTMDLIEMVLAKADPSVAAFYEKELVEPGLHAFGAELRAKLLETVRAVLEITEHPDLLTPQTDNGGQGTYTTLADKLAMRSLYITPLNIIQVANLKRLREIEAGGAKSDWKPKMQWAQEMLSLHESKDYYHAAVSDTLIITMKGIAAGMQNTG